MDEKPFQLLGEVRELLPVRSGDIAKDDSDYKRNGKQIKSKYPKICYIQYWGDSMALSGLIFEEYNLKRIILKAIES